MQDDVQAKKIVWIYFNNQLSFIYSMKDFDAILVWKEAYDFYVSRNHFKLKNASFRTSQEDFLNWFQ